MHQLLILIGLLSTLTVAGQKGFVMRDKPTQKKVEVYFNNQLLTAYCYFDSTEKPILYPVKTVSGKTVTRGYPIAPRPGERTDHPHHAGLWFNYESVNGLDFWNNSDAIPQDRKPHYGSIRHQRILSSKGEKNKATLVTLSHWVNQNGDVLLEETTTFTFRVSGSDFIIDRACVLKAIADEVFFKDVKDGMIAIRVHRSLEMPSTQEDKFVDANGIETKVPMKSNDGVTGMYYNAEGIKGDAVWSTRSPWCYLEGKIEDENVSVIIIDHSKNPGYPTYWHARGYGLFAANPLGQKIFSHGKEEMNLKLMKGDSKEFVYRIVIHSGSRTEATLVNKLRKEFLR